MKAVYRVDVLAYVYVWLPWRIPRMCVAGGTSDHWARIFQWLSHLGQFILKIVTA